MSVGRRGGRDDDADALARLPGTVGGGGARQQIGHRQDGRSGERGAAGKQAFHGFPRRSLNIVEVSRNTRALANPPHFPYQFVVRLPRSSSSYGVRAKEDILKRRTFVSGSAALAAAGFASTTAQAASIKPYSWDLNPPTDTRENFIAWGKARGEDPVFLGQLGPLPGAGQEQGHLGPGHHPRLPADAARGVPRRSIRRSTSAPTSTPSSTSATASPCRARTSRAA